MQKNLYRRIFSYLAPYKRQFAFAICCMIVFGASDGVVPFLVKYILDDVFAQHDVQMLYVLPAVLLVFALVRGAADYGQQFLLARIGHRIVRDLRTDVKDMLLHLSPDFFLKNSSANLVSRITSDVVLVKHLLTDSASAVLRDAVRIVALIVAAVLLDPLLAAIALIAFPLGVYPVYRFGRRMRKLSKRGQDEIGGLSALLQETIVGQRVVKAFCGEDFERERFAARNNALTQTFIKSERVRALTGPVNEVLSVCAVCAVILYGGHTVISGQRTQGDFIAFLVSLFLLYDPFKRLSKVNSTIQQGFSGAERIFEVLDAENSICEAAEPVDCPAASSLEFEAVWFAYNDSESVLRNIDLSVPEGAKVALVGLSGAGKTTLVDLIPRFIDPQRGQVKIAGIDIKQLRLRDLRQKIAIVGQHTFLFNDTVFNNIAYAKPDATQVEVEVAARAAFAYDFIVDELPQGFQTVLGEQGMTLSGGQRQRIAIARAIMRDAPILILDEATASLDSQSEKEVQQALDALERDRTTVVIAHRLSTVLNADTIIVLKDGEIVERGTHSELLALGAEYTRLYNLQFSRDLDSTSALSAA